MEQELSNCPSADRTFLSSTFPNTHSLVATFPNKKHFMKVKKINKIGKIGTAISSLIVILPGNKISFPAGLYYYIFMLDGLNEFIYGLLFFATFLYYLISASNNLNNKYDDICIITIIAVSYFLIFFNIDLSLTSIDTSCLITLLLFIIFSMTTLLYTIKLYKKRLELEKSK